MSAGLRPRPHCGSVQRSTDPLAGIWGAKGVEREGRGERGEKKEGRKEEEEREERKFRERRREGFNVARGQARDKAGSVCYA